MHLAKIFISKINAVTERIPPITARQKRKAMTVVAFSLLEKVVVAIVCLVAFLGLLSLGERRSAAEKRYGAPITVTDDVIRKAGTLRADFGLDGRDYVSDALRKLKKRTFRSVDELADTVRNRAQLLASSPPAKTATDPKNPAGGEANALAALWTENDRLAKEHDRIAREIDLIFPRLDVPKMEPQAWWEKPFMKGGNHYIFYEISYFFLLTLGVLALSYLLLLLVRALPFTSFEGHWQKRLDQILGGQAPVKLGTVAGAKGVATAFAAGTLLTLGATQLPTSHLAVTPSASVLPNTRSSATSERNASVPIPRPPDIPDPRIEEALTILREVHRFVETSDRSHSHDSQVMFIPVPSGENVFPPNHDDAPILKAIADLKTFHDQELSTAKNELLSYAARNAQSSATLARSLTAHTVDERGFGRKLVGGETYHVRDQNLTTFRAISAGASPQLHQALERMKHVEPMDRLTFYETLKATMWDIDASRDVSKEIRKRAATIDLVFRERH